MEDFQVHQMFCESSRVQVAGWEKGYVKYIVEITAGGKLTTVQHMRDRERGFVSAEPKASPENLGEQSRPGITILEADDAEHRYELVITHSAERVDGELEHHRKTEVLRIDRRGNVLQRQVLFNEVSTEHGD